jgi:hypothetical protein
VAEAAMSREDWVTQRSTMDWGAKKAWRSPEGFSKDYILEALPGGETTSEWRRRLMREDDTTPEFLLQLWRFDDPLPDPEVL